MSALSQTPRGFSGPETARELLNNALRPAAWQWFCLMYEIAIRAWCIFVSRDWPLRLRVVHHALVAISTGVLCAITVGKVHAFSYASRHKNFSAQDSLEAPAIIHHLRQNRLHVAMLSAANSVFLIASLLIIMLRHFFLP